MILLFVESTSFFVHLVNSSLYIHVAYDNFLSISADDIVLDLYVGLIERHLYEVLQLLNCDIQVRILSQLLLVDGGVQSGLTGGQVTGTGSLLTSNVGAAHVL